MAKSSIIVLSQDLWNNDDWFKDNPEKILGTAYQASGRFGSVTKYKGTIDDLNKIEVPDNFIGNMKSITDPLASVNDMRNPDLDALRPEMVERIDSVIHNSEKEINQKILHRVRGKKNKQDITDETIAVRETPELQTFEEIYHKYNEQISIEELEVFIWWKSHTNKPLSRRWINLVKPGTYSGDSLFIPTPETYSVSDEKIKHWVNSGLLYYYNGTYEPEVIYLSGNVYDKKAQLKRDKDVIIEKYGSNVFENQEAAFSKAFKQKYEGRLTITGNNEDGLVLIPISKMAETFQVSGLDMIAEGEKFKMLTIGAAGPEFGKPNLIKDPETSDYKRTELDSLNLKYAFAYWLQRGNPQLKEPVSTMDIILYYLLGKTVINRNEKGTIEYETEKARIEKLKSSCQREGQRLFLFFLDDQLRTNDKIRLETEWNTLYNNHLRVDYNKIPVAFTMCKYYKGKEEHLRPEKREAIAFSMVEGSACLSYDVGVGKTPSAIFTISAFMDAGYCLRPFVCVPNQVYKQFISEIKAFAPHIPVNEAYNLSRDYAANFQDADGKIIKVPAGTITVMTYEGLEQIGFSDQTANELQWELYDILDQRTAEPVTIGGNQKRNQREEAKFMERLQTIMGKGLRGTIFNIEDFGFDFGCYDEAHKMKKVFTSVKGEEEKDEKGDMKRGRNEYKINSGNPSSIALKGFMLNHYIQKNNGWQNVLLLTATPFTNSALEIFSVLSMIAYNKLKETDLNNIKSFFDTYVSTSTELVINSRLQPQFKQVILGFSNLLSLQTLIRRFVNYKTGDQVNVKRPKKYVLPYLRKLEGETVINLPEDERIETYIEMTPAQKAMQEDIVQYVEGKISLQGLKITGVNKTDIEEEDSDQTEVVDIDENVLSDKEKKGVRTIRGLTFSRNLALSPYLYIFSGMKNPDYGQYVETSPKLKYVMECIRTVKHYHEKKGEPMSGQIIYMDRGIEYFTLLKEYLVKEIGYQPHEIGIIRSGLPKNGKTSKEYVKNLFNGEIYNEDTKLFEQVSDDQRIKIIIGSSTIKEGINLQKYGTVLYNCFVDWNPTDIQQLEGRIWRQGNTFNAVRIVNPLVTDSADIFLFQKLQEKTSRLNSIWATNGRRNVLNTEEFDPEELKYALIRDPRVIAQLRSIDDIAKVDSDILGQESLIDRAKKVSEIIGTINYRFDDIVNSVDNYRDFKRTGSKLDDAERIIKTVVDLDDKQTDKTGRKIIPSYEVDDIKRSGKWNDKKMVSTPLRHSWDSSDSIEQYHKPYYFKDFALAVRDFKKLYTTFLLPNKINVSLDNTLSLDKFSERQQARIAELKELKKKLSSDEYKSKLTEQVIKERAEKNIVYKPISRAVQDFTKLNYLLSDRKVQTPVKQLAITCPPMRNGIRLTDPESVRQIDECLQNQVETKVLHLEPDNITYKPVRRALHKKIIDQIFSSVKCIKGNEPLAIFTGGAPGSGKSTYLKKIPWLMNDNGKINPNIFHIDADEIRAQLPEYTGWNSSATHQETRDIVNEVLDRVGDGNCRYDFIYDGTMNRSDKYFPLIKKVKDMGYKTFIIFMDVPYSISKQRTLDRYKRSGRYVPQDVIEDFFTVLPPPINKIKGLYSLDQLKQVVDGYVVVDGVTGEIKETKGIDLPKQRYYKKEQVFFVPKAEQRLEKSKSVANKQTIKKQITGLKVALQFAGKDEKQRIKKQVDALQVAMQFAA